MFETQNRKNTKKFHTALNTPDYNINNNNTPQICIFISLLFFDKFKSCSFLCILVQNFIPLNCSSLNFSFLSFLFFTISVFTQNSHTISKKRNLCSNLNPKRKNIKIIILSQNYNWDFILNESNTFLFGFFFFTFIIG